MLLALLTLVVLGAFSIVYFTLRLGISPMPTAPKVRRQILSILPDNVQGGVYELGAGWGTLLPLLAQQYPNLTITAFEASWFPYAFSRLRAKSIIHNSINVYCRDFFEEELDDAGLVVCYLFPSCMEKLATMLESRLRPGTWVISHTFALPNWKAVKTLRAPDIYQTPIYLYKMP